MWNRYHMSFRGDEKMPTIRDVAKEAGVSSSTVSRYLNKNGYVSEEAKKSIHAAIELLRYRPNEMARSLATKKSQMVALLVPDITNPFFTELAKEIEEQAYQYGFTMILCNIGNEHEKEKQIIEQLQQQYIAGLFIATKQIEASYYEKLQIPMVAVDRVLSEKIPTIKTDHFLGGQIACQHLMACGVENVLCIRASSEEDVANERIAGFYSCAQTLQIEEVISAYEVEATKILVLEKLQNRTYEAIFASSDAMAIGTLKAIQQMNLRIPEDIQLIGYDGIRMTEWTTPTITTIAQQITQIGQRAVRCLWKQMQNEDILERHQLVAPILIKRNSTKGE